MVGCIWPPGHNLPTPGMGQQLFSSEGEVTALLTLERKGELSKFSSCWVFSGKLVGRVSSQNLNRVEAGMKRHNFVRDLPDQLHIF